MLWSEWIESIRKDVECFFGVLKSRFRYFRNGIRYHSREVVEQAFKTACCLHNMLLLFDGLTGFNSKEWQNVDWNELDPDAKDVDENDERMDDLEIEDERDDLDLNPHTPTVCIQEDILESNNIHETVTLFKYDEPKQVLKEKLQQSFTVQWIKGKLQWPRGFDEVNVFDDSINQPTISYFLITI